MIRSLESLFQLDRWVMTAIHPRGARRRFKNDQGPVAGTSYSMPHILHIYLIHGDIRIVYLAIFILSPSNESFEQVNTGLGQCDDLPRMGMWIWVNAVHMLVQQCQKHMDPDGFHPNHVYMDKHGVYVWMVMVLLWFYCFTMFLPWQTAPNSPKSVSVLLWAVLPASVQSSFSNQRQLRQRMPQDL